MNYMKDIAKNFVAKKTIEMMRETRADKPSNARSPRLTDPKNKAKRESKSMTPALRNLRPQTAQPSAFGSPLKKIVEKEPKAGKDPMEMTTPKTKGKEEKASPIKKAKK